MKLILRLVAIAAFAIAVDGRANIGVHGGANLHDVSTEPSSTTSRVNKEIFGAHLEFPLLLGLSLVPEVNYKNNGTKYLGIPVMARYHLFPAFIKPFLTAGPEFAFAIGDSAGIKSTDFLLNVGAGLAITFLPKIDLWAQGRYSFGVTNILDNSNPNVSVKNRDIQILVGITFHLSDDRN